MTSGNSRTIEQYTIAEQLGESAPQAVALIGRILRQLGVEETRLLAAQAIATEQAGGMLTDDGSRRRTVGGIFFVLVKQHLHTTGRTELEQSLFPRRRARPARPEAAPAAPRLPSIPPTAQGRLRPRVRGRSEAVPGSPFSPDQPDDTPAPRPAPPSQAAVLAALDRHLGPAPDIYRRSYNPDTGALTLSAHFPPVARARYASALSTAAAEAGVPIAISSQPHHGMLDAAARSAIPPGAVVRILIQAGRETIVAQMASPLDQAALDAAREQVRATTGWQLEVSVVEGLPAQRATGPMDPNAAISEARRLLPAESGVYGVGAQNQSQTLVVRFHFPDIARGRYAEVIDTIRATTGWDVAIHPSPHQEMLAAAARAVLPPGAEPVGAPSLRFERHTLVLRYRGALDEQAAAAARTQFQDQTGWALELSSEKDQEIKGG
jgi:hypothetical protein